MDDSRTLAVRAENLTKRFGHITAVAGLNLEVKSGEVVALLGANGSGKSTTFRLLLNIYKPTEGRAELLGRRCDALDGDDFDKVAFVSESQKLPLWMTVRQYLEYCGQFYLEWDREFCERLLVGFQVEQRQKIKFLSRGQKMKVAVTSVLPSRPRVLLLDEPFSGLDVETRAQLSDLLKSLAKEDRLTTILTTHDVEEVEPVADRLVILAKGALAVDEPLSEFLSRHRRIRFRNLKLEDLPKERLRPIRVESEGDKLSVAIIENYDPSVESLLPEGMGAEVDCAIESMTLREILAAKAVQL